MTFISCFVVWNISYIPLCRHVKCWLNACFQPNTKLWYHHIYIQRKNHKNVNKGKISLTDVRQITWVVLNFDGIVFNKKSTSITKQDWYAILSHEHPLLLDWTCKSIESINAAATSNSEVEVYGWNSSVGMSYEDGLRTEIVGICKSSNSWTN